MALPTAALVDVKVRYIPQNSLNKLILKALDPIQKGKMIIKNNWLNLVQWQMLNNQTQKWGKWALFISSISDASIFPAPILSVFIAMLLMNFKKADNYIILATLGTFFGALAGYFLGYSTTVNLNIGSTGFLQFFNDHVPGLSADGFQRIQILYKEWNMWILFMASFSPIPYGLFSISSGIFKINLTFFCITTLVCQGAKFWLLAVFIKKIGPRIKDLFSRKSVPCVILLPAVISYLAA
jgi:membrane protein YqaA with SNARE-associated domain